MQNTHVVKSRAHSPRPTSKINTMIALRRAILMKADLVVSLHAHRLFSGHACSCKKPCPPFSVFNSWVYSRGCRVFPPTWPACMQIYWNKRKRLHKKRVQLPQDWFGTQTWPPFHCFGTQIWPPWHHVKTHNREHSRLVGQAVGWLVEWLLIKPYKDIQNNHIWIFQSHLLFVSLLVWAVRQLSSFSLTVIHHQHQVCYLKLHSRIFFFEKLNLRK